METFGLRAEAVGEKRERRIEALRRALDSLADAGVVIAADVDVVCGARPPSELLSCGTWDYDAEKELAAELGSVMDRLAGLVFRLEREHESECKRAGHALKRAA